MDKNREFAEMVGIPWHDEEFDIPTSYYDNEKKEWIHGVIEIRNPDFTDPRLVLREMDKQPAKIRHLFYAKLIYNGNNVEAIDDDGLISRHYMTDQTGKLRDKAIEWMKGKS